MLDDEVVSTPKKCSYRPQVLSDTHKNGLNVSKLASANKVLTDLWKSEEEKRSFFLVSFHFKQKSAINKKEVKDGLYRLNVLFIP